MFKPAAKYNFNPTVSDTCICNHDILTCSWKSHTTGDMWSTQSLHVFLMHRYWLFLLDNTGSNMIFCCYILGVTFHAVILIQQQ